MELNSDTVKSETLGHLGLVAATITELGIIDKIDSRIELNESKGGIVSYGRRVAAMLINGLGFMNSRLYMSTHFFQDKPVSNLLGAEVTAENLNDDCLGRCLDKIADYGVTKLFSEIAFEIAHEQNLLGTRLHLDSTSFVLYGDYPDEEGSPLPMYGFSKENRADLKQVMLSLTMGGAANLPLWMEAMDGNSSDKKSFHETVTRVKQFMSQLKNVPDDLCFIVDAAFYDSKKLVALDNVRWITRVPSTLKEGKLWQKEFIATDEWSSLDENYRSISKKISINGLEQRWVMYFSNHAYHREIKTLGKRIEKSYEQLNKQLWHLSCENFSCENDADLTVKDIIKKLKYHTVDYKIVSIEKYATTGRPNSNTSKRIVGYRIEYAIASDLNKIVKIKGSLGRFILATNQLCADSLSDASILGQYKEQSQVESGFKFIKNDSFELSSFFLKTPRRIEALMMIMTLCLLVYNFAQYHIRKCLKEFNDVLPNQHGKPTQKPTLKWLAEVMVVIAVVTIKTEEFNKRIVTNLNQVHKKIIGYFGMSALKIYGMPDDYEQVEINYLNYKNFLNWCEM